MAFEQHRRLVLSCMLDFAFEYRRSILSAEGHPLSTPPSAGSLSFRSGHVAVETVLSSLAVWDVDAPFEFSVHGYQRRARLFRMRMLCKWWSSCPV